MNSLIGKNEEEIKDFITQTATSETGLTNMSSGGVFRGIIEVIHKLTWNVYRTVITVIYEQISIDSATGFFLDLWGGLCGVYRFVASKTRGSFIITASTTLTVPAQTAIVCSFPSVRFYTEKDVSITEGEHKIPVLAEDEGSACNIPHGSVLRIPKVISGIEGVHALENWIQEAGRDAESDESYRLRIKAKWQSQTLGNITAKYEKIALDNKNVSQVKIIRAPRGYGSIDVFACDVLGNLPPTLQHELYVAYENDRMVCRSFFIKAPVYTAVPISISYKGDYSIEEITQFLQTFFLNLKIGENVLLKDVYKFFERYDFERLVIHEPVGDIELLEYHLARAQIKEIVKL